MDHADKEFLKRGYKVNKELIFALAFALAVWVGLLTIFVRASS